MENRLLHRPHVVTKQLVRLETSAIAAEADCKRVLFWFLTRDNWKTHRRIANWDSLTGPVKA